MKSQLLSWLTYLRLRREDGARVASLELWIAVGLGIVFAAFWYWIGLPQSFGKDGLIDGLGSIASVLAGFYVAGLVAIATFFRENSSLDDVIQSGPAILNLGQENEDRLTRRQYVCSIFGFLVAISFFLAISAVVMRSSSQPIAHFLAKRIISLDRFSLEASSLVEVAGILIWMTLFLWQILLTLRGLYYLMDRIYDMKPILSKPKVPRVRQL